MPQHPPALIDAVAKAIYFTWRKATPWNDTINRASWETLPPTTKAEFRAEAAAAIDAMISHAQDAAP